MSLKVTNINRISVTNLAEEGNESSHNPSFSPDGTKIVFHSSATNFIENDANGWRDVFVKDSVTGEITSISTNSTGEQGNLWSYDGRFSPDGTKIVFHSGANNLIENDINAWNAIFIKDLLTNEVMRVDVSALGEPLDGSSYNARFSPDGTKIIFESSASNLVEGDTNGWDDLFIKDLLTNELTRVSVNALGEEGNGWFYNGSFSPDGTKIIFESWADNLIAEDSNGEEDIFMKDLLTGEITRLSTNFFGEEGTLRSHNPQFSPDGTQVLFTSWADNLVENDTNNLPDIFVKDIISGEVLRVNTNAMGEQLDGWSFGTANFSPDGTQVVFESLSSTLVEDDTNGWYDIFVKDLRTGEVSIVSRTPTDEQANGWSRNPSFSPDGMSIVFESQANNLVENDSNEHWDIFHVTLSDTETEFSAFDDVQTTTQNTSLFIDVLANDRVFVTDILEIVSIEDVVGGTAIVDGNQVLFTPTIDFVGEASFFYTATDGQTISDAQVTVTVLPSEDTPYTIISGTEDAEILTGSSERDVIEGFDGGDLLYGNEEHDILYGDAGADTLWGWTGDDLIYGGGDDDFIGGDEGHDTIDGDAGNDSIWGWSGEDSIMGGEGNDLLSGEHGADILDGGMGANLLYGGNDDDRLVSGFGSNNTLEGGEGNDMFEFTAAENHLITDFTLGVDTLRFTSSTGISSMDDLVMIFDEETSHTLITSNSSNLTLSVVGDVANMLTHYDIEFVA
ncbi:MAG: hypothetical protein EAZ74_05990 [Alphaproteobacteria bacterium]|nr:MAG: hypothetical protein EAY76_05710 [Alphaproteobacteria bacterium]TAF13305.1 MAG: hypothetical protein EAZ74_05990 [Alphaproteobacteria bacterium]